MVILRKRCFPFATPYHQVVKVLKQLLRWAECLDLSRILAQSFWFIKHRKEGRLPPPLKSGGLRRVFL